MKTFSKIDNPFVETSIKENQGADDHYIRKPNWE
jgi:hypothetical protein